VPIRSKRVYETYDPGDGKRYLVDRLWPRGLAKARLRIEAWLPDLGPSHDLRRWFGHDPSKWSGFKKRYFEELSHKKELWAPVLSAATKGPVTLLFSARDPEHNQAVALSEFLRRRAGTARKSAKK